MPFAEINGVNLYYEIHGDGYPVLNLCGLGAQVANFKDNPALVDGVSSKFKFILFDNRGIGESELPAENHYDIHQLAADAVGLLDYLGITKAHIFGASMGGMTAQQLALDFPEYVDKLVLQCTWPGRPQTTLPDPEVYRYLTSPGCGDATQMKGINPLRLTFSPKFLDENPELAEFLTGLIFEHRDVAAGLAAQQVALKNFNVYDRLPEIKAKTLVLSAKYDICIPPENGVTIATRIPDATFILMQKSAHCFLEEQDLMVKTVLDFLCDR